MTQNKLITLIALIALTLLVLPVSAVWMNGNWYTDDQYAKLTDGATVICTGKNSDQCSKYRDTNPALGNDVVTAAGTCNLAGTLSCGYTTLTPIVYISNVLDTNKTQTPLAVDHNGRYEYRGLAKGNYTLYVPDGNGGQPEYSTVQCLGSGDVWPFRQILGHGVTADSEESASAPTVVSDITICSAFYYPDLTKSPIEGHVKLNWGNHFGIANVRSNVQALVDSGKTTFDVSNKNLGGDPAYGWYKAITVKYVHGSSCEKVCTRNYHCEYPDYHYASAKEYQQITLL